MKFYLCNGCDDKCSSKEGCGTCRPINCYMNGGGCKYTTNAKFAKNIENGEDMKFRSDNAGNLWEIEPDEIDLNDKLNLEEKSFLITCIMVAAFPNLFVIILDIILNMILILG